MAGAVRKGRTKEIPLSEIKMIFHDFFARRRSRRLL